MERALQGIANNSRANAQVGPQMRAISIQDFRDAVFASKYDQGVAHELYGLRFSFLQLVREQDNPPEQQFINERVRNHCEKE